MLLKQNTIYAAMDRVPSQQGRGTCNFKLFDSASAVLQNIPNYARTMRLTGLLYHYFMKVIQQPDQTIHSHVYPPTRPPPRNPCVCPPLHLSINRRVSKFICINP